MKATTLQILEANIEIIFMILKEFLHHNTKIASHKGKGWKI